MTHPLAGTRYRPSNGTEGEGFIGCWCEECERDAQYTDATPELGCQILARTFVFDVDDPNYPAEWTYDAGDNPCCTAFIAVGGQVPTDTELEAAGQLVAIHSEADKTAIPVQMYNTNSGQG